jgi:hypothetical protein
MAILRQPEGALAETRGMRSYATFFTRQGFSAKGWLGQMMLAASSAL